MASEGSFQVGKDHMVIPVWLFMQLIDGQKPRHLSDTQVQNIKDTLVREIKGPPTSSSIDETGEAPVVTIGVPDGFEPYKPPKPPPKD